ncbi:hypothetical protein LWI28_014591 [Acer negundo]|uniref:mitogen-activated protein kinase kinase kinase n=1 Tax=Acer negundo TaxID=4023 RepID=A0AAD5IJT6_ACENE|nr:hypothetical protein LWI28_014591 [Acer negundo]KAK4840580.1 hypothetical protein QYF36_012806 [Acer negundo]
MRWLQNISFSHFPSSSSSNNQTTAAAAAALLDDRSSYSSSRSTRNGNNNNNNNSSSHNNKKDLRGPRLTRQKKLRHLSDQEVIGVSKVAPHFTESVGLSRSQSSYDHFSSPSPSPSPSPSTLTTTTSALKSSLSTSTARPMPLPLPLPLPEENGELRLPSPKDTGGLGRAAEERERERERDGFRDRDRVDGAAEGVPSSSFPIASVFSDRVSRISPEYLDKKSYRNVHRKDRNSVESSREKFRLDIPFKSAPTSPFGSPLHSPQRMSVSEMFQYNHKIPIGNHQVWSAPEMPTIDVPGLPPPAFFDYTAISADNSPFHSPRSRSPCRNPISPNGPSSPINSKLSRESTGHIEVHPLPLPPGAAIPSPSSPIPQVPAKPESLPMKCQWQKGKLIGRGTFGSVYVASNRETGALCAMKEVEMFPDDPKSAECIKQLEQEIKVLSNLKHPNIVQYYGSEIVEDKFYIYLEYVHPGSINKYGREHCGAMTESIVRNFTRHILSGLAYLHSKKTIHRDIKGANLLVDASGVVKLADFGMAKHLTGQAADLSLKGSPYWMAPELMISVMQRDNNSDLALAVDIWSLGCTIIEMYTGKPPWSEFEGAAAMFKVMKDTPSIPESLSADGKDFLRCCFRRNPACRPLASKLLEHRFLKNSQQQPGVLSSYRQSFSGMKLIDKLHSPREQSESKIAPLAISPSPSTKKKVFESERQQSQLETSDLTYTPRSPRSILEALPSASTPSSRHSTCHPVPSALTLGLISSGTKTNGMPR